MFHFRKFGRRTILLSAGVAAIVGTAGVAEAKNEPSGPAVQKYEMMKTKDGTVKYCVRIPPVTGTWISQKICKTPKEWSAVGVTLNIP